MSYTSLTRPLGPITQTRKPTFVKQGGEWLIRGPAELLTSGSTVTVFKKDKSVSYVTCGETVRTDSAQVTSLDGNSMEFILFKYCRFQYI